MALHTLSFQVSDFDSGMTRKLKIDIGPLVSRRTLLIWGVSAVLVAAAGPFGTYETQGFWTRLLYWSLVVVSSSILAHVVNMLTRRIIPPHRAVLNDLSVVALMVLLFAPVLWFLTNLVFYTGPEDRMALSRLSVYVAIVTAAICVIRRVLPGFEPAGYLEAAAAGQFTPPRLTRRLPRDFNGSILRLTGRDHFVDVVSSEGSCTIRLRFGDAIDEMDTVTGFCTHRSHWVARRAIAEVERENGRIHLRLVNGDLVPVSRKYKPKLEAAGVL